MNGLNKVQLIGNLGQEPNIVRFETGIKAEFNLATQDGYKDQAGTWQTVTDWHRCYATGKIAETIEKYVTKGMRIYVEGKLKTRSWNDPNKGTQYITEVRITDFMFLSNKKEDNLQGYTTNQTPQNNTQNENEHDDLPF